eukprot:TRINITY_DN30136_c0_g1_i1.p1 TRINITY_DN30136_c0_g1~~TRINITY_DN30136_c0_g1_i1.p1  ORF type:complete len:445 (-),score=84.22 TRINITY_DN30136_c0_g1_i1:233-1567(-)
MSVELFHRVLGVAALLLVRLACYCTAADADATRGIDADPLLPTSELALLADDAADACTISRSGGRNDLGGESALCAELSLRQLRATIAKAEARQHDTSAEQSAALEELLVSIAADKSGNHSHVRATDDYRRDAELYLKTYSGGNLPSCNLKRTSLKHAESFWGFSLDSALKHATSLHQFDTAAAEAVDPMPWMPDKPELPLNAYDLARKHFASALFSGKPGLVDGVADKWPAMELWRTQEDLIARVSGRRIALMNWTFDLGIPAQAEDVPPETLSEYVERGDSAQNLFVFVNEAFPGISQKLTDLVEDLASDIQPLPSFAAKREEQHAILAIDGAGSSHAFHQHAAVWQTQVTGRKAWWLMPPSVPSVDGQQKRPPMVDGRVYGNPNACEMLLRRSPPAGAQICVMEPGDTMILPSDWWHATCGLDVLTASMGGWFEDQMRREE